jgi:hypothetical protein
MKWFALSTVLVITGLLAPGAGSAQTACWLASGWCAVQTGMSLNIAPVVELSAAPASTNLTSPAKADYDAGEVIDAALIMAIKANTGWVVKAQSENAAWTALNTGGVRARQDKPAADLELGLGPTGPFIGLDVAGVDILKGNATDGANSQIYFRTKYAWSLDRPGTYQLPFVFSVMVP